MYTDPFLWNICIYVLYSSLLILLPSYMLHNNNNNNILLTSLSPPICHTKWETGIRERRPDICNFDKLVSLMIRSVFPLFFHFHVLTLIVLYWILYCLRTFQICLTLMFHIDLGNVKNVYST